MNKKYFDIFLTILVFLRYIERRPCVLNRPTHDDLKNSNLFVFSEMPTGGLKYKKYVLPALPIINSGKKSQRDIIFMPNTIGYPTLDCEASI